MYEDISNAINDENDAVYKLRIFNDELWDQEWYLVITVYNIYTSFFCNNFLTVSCILLLRGLKIHNKIVLIYENY